MRLRLAPLSLFVLLLLSGCAGREPTRDDRANGVVDLEEVVSGLSSPLYVTHDGVDPDRLYIVEQGGLVRSFEDGRLAHEPFLDLRQKVTSGGERGLLGLAFSPDYLDDERVYAAYTDRNGDSVLARYTRDAQERLDVNSEEVLLFVDQPYANHNGGNIVFGPDGYLYYGLGDGGSGGDPEGNAQDKGTLLGSILRLDVSGDAYSVPADNPFVGDASARGEIWAYGLRNPWRSSFDRATGDLWIGDVGQDAEEEIDHQSAGSKGGENYGWDRYEGERHSSGSTSRTGLTFPVVSYDRAGGHCAVTGGYVYRGDEVRSLQGAYVFADYCSGQVSTFRADQGGAFRLLSTDHRISSFGEDLAGELYVVDHQGKVLRFVER